MCHDEVLRVGVKSVGAKRVHGAYGSLRQHRKPLHGFTLIELLVVISVIALLIAILLPALKKARDVANAGVCGSNLRQLDLSLHVYSDDHQSFFPQTWGGNAGQDGTQWQHTNWSRLIFFYAGNVRELYKCPSQSPGTEPLHAGNPSFWRNLAATLPQTEGASYTYNTYLNPDNRSYLHSAWPELTAALRIEQVVKASNVPAIVDGLWMSNADRYAPPGHPEVGPWADETFSWWLNAPAARHSGAANMAFADGHVGALPARWDDLPQPAAASLFVTADQGVDFQPRGDPLSVHAF